MFQRRREVEAQPTTYTDAETARIKAVVDGQSRTVHDPQATYELARISQGRRAA